MTIKKLTIWTIVLSVIIIIGAGHGIGFLGLMEIGGFINRFKIGTENFSLSLNSSYDNSIFPSALFALLGHLFLFVSLFKKNFLIQIAGLCFLWISFYYLIHDFISDPAALLGLFTGIPFLIFSGILFYRIIKQKNQIERA